MASSRKKPPTASYGSNVSRSGLRRGSGKGLVSVNKEETRQKECGGFRRNLSWMERTLPQPPNRSLPAP